MAFINIKEAKTIWGLPVLIYLITSVLLVLLFMNLRAVYPNNVGILELVLTFTLQSLFLATWIIVRIRYERVKKVKIRKTLRWAESFFIIVYIVSILQLLWEFVIRPYVLNSG